MYFKKINLVKIFLILPIVYFLIFEIIARLIVFIFIANASIFFYGFNKNINITTHSFKNKEIFVTKISDNSSFKINKIKSSDSEIWIFGGSTSNNGFCDSKKLSWVDFLETKSKVKNFSKNGIYSNYSLKILEHKLQYEKPNTIIWANKVNEILYSKRQASFKNVILKNIHSIKKTFKNNSVFFYFSDEIVIRVFDKLGFNIRLENPKLTPKSYDSASNNFYENSKKAIQLAKKNNISQFYIVSLFNKKNIINKENVFFRYYVDKVIKLTNEYNFVKFINTKNFLNEDDREKLLFCDSMHQTLEGKILTAKIVSKAIND